MYARMDEEITAETRRNNRPKMLPAYWGVHRLTIYSNQGRADCTCSTLCIVSLATLVDTTMCRMRLGGVVVVCLMTEVEVKVNIM